MLYNMVFFLAKNEKDRQMSRFPGRDICGAVKNPRFLNSPIFVDFCRPKGCISTPDGKNVKNGLKNVGKM
jgi:hypothetical protein